MAQRDEKKVAEFMKQFKFQKDRSLLVGIERECFITDKQGNIIPYTSEILKYLTDREHLGYELSACQFEDRVGPVKIEKVKEALFQNERDIMKIEKKLGFRRLHAEVISENMPLDVYPDPTGRYQKITKNMPKHILLAACQVAGTHVHIGMPDHETALNVYKNIVKKRHNGEYVFENLCKAGDNSNGERLRIYKIMAPDYFPPSYLSWFNFYDEAVKKGFKKDPRKCWHLIRISVHGTIEFRMFGATPNIDKIVCWANTCYQFCEKSII